MCNGLDPLLDEGVERQLKLIHRYARQNERTFHQSLKELKSLQTERALQAQAPAPNEATEAAPLANAQKVHYSQQAVDRQVKQHVDQFLNSMIQQPYSSPLIDQLAAQAAERSEEAPC
jgi:thiamine biosynthesis lipoprotein ApbE